MNNNITRFSYASTLSFILRRLDLFKFLRDLVTVHIKCVYLKISRSTHLPSMLLIFKISPSWNLFFGGLKLAFLWREGNDMICFFRSSCSVSLKVLARSFKESLVSRVWLWAKCSVTDAVIFSFCLFGQPLIYFFFE